MKRRKRRLNGRNTKNNMEGKIKIFGRSIYDTAWIDNSVFTNFKDADAIVLPGGSDWSPILYGQTFGRFTNSNKQADIEQGTLLLSALNEEKMIIGICRGLQGMHIAAGGSLIQHVNNHREGGHDIVDMFTNEVFYVNSLHHQMVNLDSLLADDYSLLAHPVKSLSNTYLDNNDTEILNSDKILLKFKVNFKEPEIVYYNKIHGIGFQYHPEMMNHGLRARQYSSELVHNVFNEKAIIYDSSIISSIINDFEYRLQILTNEKEKTIHLPAKIIPNTQTKIKKQEKNETDWSCSIKEL